MNNNRALRHAFARNLLDQIKLVWPIVSGLLGMMALTGIGIAALEGWHLLEGLYFAFVTGLTVGYGDLVPKQPLGRILAIAIGFMGILLTALFAAMAVRSLEAVSTGKDS